MIHRTREISTLDSNNYTVVIDHLKTPTHLTEHPRSGDLYITDQPGYIYRLTDDKKQSKLWLDLSHKIFPLAPQYDEGGLLAMIFTDDGDGMYLFSSRRVQDHKTTIETFPIFSSPHVDMTSPDLHLDVISRIPLSEDQDGLWRPIPEQEVIYLGFLRDQRIHHGGKLLLDGDYLYITVGDASPEGDLYQHGQDLSVPFGKILRIIPHHEGSYLVPDDNPFSETTNVLPEIYAYGFRNPWSISQQSNRGNIFIGDVGQDSWEEINILIAGRDYTSWLGAKIKLPDITFVDPIFQYPDDPHQPTAIVGGCYFEKSHHYPTGYYLADISGLLMMINYTEGEWLLKRIWRLPASIYGCYFAHDNLYLLINSQREGQVIRLETLK